ncbi:MAG: hypothetical protein V2A65_09160 [Candidatus Omnitrophota bacterium]
MKRKTVRRCLLFCLLISIIFSRGAFAAENLALHKPYTMEPMPNYHYLDDPMCTDAGDKVQLTDGQRTTFRGAYMWFCREAIGVGVGPKDKIFRVVIDLGQSHPIGRVMVSTAARCPEAGLTLNSFVLAFSEDGKTYRVMDRVTPLQTLGSDTEREKPRQGVEVNLDGSGGSARYVCVAVIPNSLIVMDEIEVYPAENVAPRAPLFECKYEELPDKLTLRASRTVLDQPLFAELYEILLKSQQVREESYFLSQLRDLDGAHEQAMGESESACEKTMAPLPGLAAEWNRTSRKSLPDLMVWPANPYETPTMFAVPPDQPHEQTLYLLGNQKGIAAVNVSWKGRAPARSTATFTGPAGAELRRAYRSDAVTGVGTARVADALILEKDNPLTLTPGVIEQLLLFIPPGAKGTSARYTLQLQAEGAEPVSFTVKVERATTTLPETFETANGGWFYLDWDTKLVPAEVQAKYLRDSHVNIATFTWASIAVPVFNTQGDVVKPAGESQYDLVKLAQLQSFCRYFFFGFNPFSQLKWEEGKPPADPDIIAKAYAECMRQNIERLKPLGIQPDQILLAPADEDMRNEKWVPVRKALEKLLPPRPKLFCTMWIPAKDTPEVDSFIKAVDIFVPGRGPWYREGGDPANLLPRMRAEGKEVWSYDCVSTVAASPNHYRLYPWEMLVAGSRGNLWWPHDSGQPLWTPSGAGWALYYGKRGAPADLKIEEDLVPSRRMEAWRQGIEDRWMMEEVRALAKKRLEQKPSDPLSAMALAYVDQHLALALTHPEDASVTQETSQWLVRMLDTLK